MIKKQMKADIVYNVTELKARNNHTKLGLLPKTYRKKWCFYWVL